MRRTTAAATLSADLTAEPCPPPVPINARAAPQASVRARGGQAAYGAGDDHIARVERVTDGQQLPGWSNRDGCSWVRGRGWTLPASVDLRVSPASQPGSAVTATSDHVRVPMTTTTTRTVGDDRRRPPHHHRNRPRKAPR